MAKSKKLNAEMEVMEENPITIISATIKEEHCIFGYEMRKGPCAGDKVPTRKGANLIHEDMEAAFSKLTVHLANLDDAFGTDNPDSLNQRTTYDAMDLYSVKGFKIMGVDDNEKIIILGEKIVTHGHISLESPAVSKNSNYAFFEELEEAITACRDEVDLYMNGKQAPSYEQTEMEFDALKTEDKAFDSPM